jgi:hypothetical protein
MTENQDEKINFTSLFLVTGVSFALFALVLDLIDGQNIKFLWWISRISLVLGILTATYAWVNRSSRTGENTE